VLLVGNWIYRSDQKDEVLAADELLLWENSIFRIFEFVRKFTNRKFLEKTAIKCNKVLLINFSRIGDNQKWQIQPSRQFSSQGQWWAAVWL
jgi:hypothetical protein